MYKNQGFLYYNFYWGISCLTSVLAEWCMGRCVPWVRAAPRLPPALHMRFYLSCTDVGGVAIMDLVQQKCKLSIWMLWGGMQALRLLHGHVWFWASPRLWLSVNIGFNAPISQLDKLVFCGNVPKRSSVTLLMRQYMTLNKPLNVFHLLHL